MIVRARRHCKLWLGGRPDAKLPAQTRLADVCAAEAFRSCWGVGDESDSGGKAKNDKLDSFKIAT
jgi:hypothetical protein